MLCPVFASIFESFDSNLAESEEDKTVPRPADKSGSSSDKAVGGDFRLDRFLDLRLVLGVLDRREFLGISSMVDNRAS
jgi:hypothetical protein